MSGLTSTFEVALTGFVLSFMDGFGFTGGVIVSGRRFGDTTVTGVESNGEVV